jgi:23S rRNA (cytosine1962-C5)-methyltransferase
VLLEKLKQHIQIPVNTGEAQRLFHGRGHGYAGLHHICIDWLPPVVLITLYAPVADAEIAALADHLSDMLAECKSIQLQHRYELAGPVDVIRGETIHSLTIHEDGLRYQISLGKSRNTGLFLDMRNGRRWVREHALNKRVLNLFSYTCGFSVAAIAGGAKSVVNIDMSSAALSVGRKNHQLNQQSLEQVRFEKLNIFKSFGRLKKRGPFDLLICDPPTLQKGSVDIERDYPKIMRRLDEFMAPGASLMMCINAPDLNGKSSRDFLFEQMQTHAPKYHFVEEIKAPAVFVEAEDKGLNVFCFIAQ